MPYTSADLSFDPVAHAYRLPDGSRLPSVTEILKSTGVSVDFDALGQQSNRLRAAIELKRDLGTALHADAHALDDNDLDWSTVDPRVEPYLRAWATFRENSRVVPVTRERRLFHPTLRYAGTMDGIFRAPGGPLVLIDIKTGDPESAGGRYQTAGYAVAYQLDRAAEPIHERWCVQLAPDRTVPYVVTPYRDWSDLLAWQAIVTTFYCQAERWRAA